MAQLGMTLRLVLLIAAFAGACAPSEAECYSPTQNLATAYQGGSLGCTCGANDRDQCVGGVALICDGGRWQAVEDGPCAPGPGEECGKSLCSRSAFCSQNDAGVPTCVSKFVPGAACSEDKQCHSEKCSAGTCAK